ncbi:oxidoreductase [Xanthomonas campestris]|uniref:oxidoreductase n=1 Tax=Xanthomonas TaxID=338 RepID=UPI001E4D26C2|nr:oxidoreductase [Xanthomonas campestris]MCC5090468.1 SDR family NAD(P)-dependent oxidoreductase [Xanthomonas campestris]
MQTENQTWLITGCSTGFGRHLALHLLEQGRQVVATARRLDSIQELGAYANATLLALDVTDASKCSSVVSEVQRRLGRLDVVVNNAGIGYFGAVEETPASVIDRLFAVNYRGTANMIQAALPVMRSQRRGTLANLTSIGGLCGYPAVGHYCASKFAVEGLSDALRHEVAPLGIRVLTIEPSAFRTEWAGSAEESAETIADYEATAGRARRAYHESVGQQPGDPARAAAAIVRAIDTPKPPERLLLGQRAYEDALRKIDNMREEFVRWRDAAVTADFPST